MNTYLNQNAKEDLSIPLQTIQCLLKQVDNIPRPLRLSLYNAAFRMEALLRENHSRKSTRVKPLLENIVMEKRLQYPSINFKLNIEEEKFSQKNTALETLHRTDILENLLSYSIDTALLQCPYPEQTNIHIYLQNSKIVLSTASRLPFLQSSKMAFTALEKKYLDQKIPLAIRIKKNFLLLEIDFKREALPAPIPNEIKKSTDDLLLHLFFEKALARYNS